MVVEEYERELLCAELRESNEHRYTECDCEASDGGVGVVGSCKDS